MAVKTSDGNSVGILFEIELSRYSDAVATVICDKPSDANHGGRGERIFFAEGKEIAENRCDS